MEKQIRWLRVSYWTGAVIDGLAALQLLVPNMFATINQLPDFHPSFAYTYAAGMAASLMLGWMVLLLWADRKPLERKGVLVITIVPVIVGLVVTETWAALSGFISLGALVPILILQATLIALFAYSYLQASGQERFSRVRPVDRRKHL
jgi:hypothetical protein